jgi:RHS repeat-associated protein
VISSYTFEYDAAGNIVSESSPYLAPSVSLQNIPNIDTTYTEDNRLATFNGQEVQFDADGNMILGPLNGKMSSYTYDSRNRLVAAGNLTYEYDAENNRIGVTEDVNGSPVKTEYVVNPNAALSQVLMKTVGNEQTYYVYGIGLIGQETAGTYSTYHFDLRGSTVAITDANGKVTDRYQYSAYGEIICSSGNTATPFLYNGRDGVMTDANGLYYMRARYYNPEIRRFVSQDILLGVVIDGQSLNRYAYVQGNPIGFVDPLGLARDGQNIWGKIKNYLKASGKQVLLGNYTDDVTLLGTGVQVGSGILGVDLPADIRDISADLKNWEWTWSHAGKTGLDIIGVFPLIGGLKYVDEGKALIKSTNEYVNLASPNRTKHILYGDKTGGGHLWPGQPGKSVFPKSWSADKAMHNISDIVTDPSLSWQKSRVVQGVQRYEVTGVRDGVKIKVITDGTDIITAFPVE